MKKDYIPPTVSAIHIGPGIPLTLSHQPFWAEGKHRGDFDFDDEEDEEEPFITPLQKSADYFGYTTYKDMQNEMAK